MLKGRKTTKEEPFVLKFTSFLLTVGDVRNGDNSQDFIITSMREKPDLEALGIALGVQCVRHPEALFVVLEALRVAKDPDTWESEGKEMPQGDIDEYRKG